MCCFQYSSVIVEAGWSRFSARYSNATEYELFGESLDKKSKTQLPFRSSHFRDGADRIFLVLKWNRSSSVVSLNDIFWGTKSPVCVIRMIQFCWFLASECEVLWRSNKRRSGQINHSRWISSCDFYSNIRALFMRCINYVLQQKNEICTDSKETSQIVGLGCSFCCPRIRKSAKKHEETNLLFNEQVKHANYNQLTSTEAVEKQAKHNHTDVIACLIFEWFSLFA